MKLYYSPGTCALACHIVLEWIGKPYDLQKVNIHNPKSPELLKVNPQGAVPVLEVDGWVLTQNLAIMNYLADSCATANYFGDSSAKQRADINRWLGFLNSDLHTAQFLLFGSTAYLRDAAAIEQTKDNASKTIVRMLTTVNEHLAKQDYLTGTRSPADAYLYVVLRWVKAD
ncbi:MAG: glutathione S-transferase N-terminal domain-containing protein [Pseudomonadales bacterium]